METAQDERWFLWRFCTLGMKYYFPILPSFGFVIKVILWFNREVWSGVGCFAFKTFHVAVSQCMIKLGAEVWTLSILYWFIGVELILAWQEVVKWVWPPVSQYRMFFVHTSTSNMDSKLTKHGKFCLQINRLQTKTPVEPNDKSIWQRESLAQLLLQAYIAKYLDWHSNVDVVVQSSTWKLNRVVTHWMFLLSVWDFFMLHVAALLERCFALKNMCNQTMKNCAIKGHIHLECSFWRHWFHFMYTLELWKEGHRVFLDGCMLRAYLDFTLN